MGTEKLTSRITVRFSSAQLAALQEAAERRGVEVSVLARDLALAGLNSMTPEEAKRAIAEAYQDASAEILPEFEPADAPLETQLEKLGRTEADLRARKSKLQAEKTELTRQRAGAMRAGDANRAADLGREIADLDHEIATIDETLVALTDNRRELRDLVEQRDSAIKAKARELLADELARAANAVDVELKRLAEALDALAILWGETRPGGETFAEWSARLVGHLWDRISETATTAEVRELARQRRPFLLGFEPGLSLAERLKLPR